MSNAFNQSFPGHKARSIKITESEFFRAQLRIGNFYFYYTAVYSKTIFNE